MSILESSGTIRLSDVVSALSVALDLTEGQPMGHSIRSCILGMRIAEDLGLSQLDRSHLYYALLLKDSGCSSNAARMHQILGSDDIQAKREVKFVDWTRPSLSGLRYAMRNVLPGQSFIRRFLKAAQLGLQQKRNNAEMIGARCHRGAEIARKIGMSEPTAQAIRSLDEHWNGQGYPEGLRGEEIPLLARILNVSQTLEVFATRSGVKVATRVIAERGGSWFDPEIVRIVQSLENDKRLWNKVSSYDARTFVMEMEPGIGIPASPERIDELCHAFAEVIDAKSPYTFNHSMGVAAAALEIAQGLGLAPQTITLVRRAALLHDIGKLSVSNSVLEKPGKLDDREWEVMRMHPVYTKVILETISGFEHLAFVAAAHHERLDGKGYPEGLNASQLPLTARIICVADVFAALVERRPYREGLPLEEVFRIMDKSIPLGLDADCFAVLKQQKKAGSAAKFRGMSTGV
jgi:putative nucleotidyltransferase with HDIG domain